VEAVQYVHVLNIMKGCEMYIPAARRFTNVEEVNILCLFELMEEEDDEDEDVYSSISLEVSNGTVPFLGSFAKLTRGFIGGLYSNGDRLIHDGNYASDIEDEDLYRSLLSAYVGAIRTGALSQQIALEGMRVSLLGRFSCRGSSTDCQWCRDILSHFPLNDLLRFLVSPGRDNMFCQTKQEVWRIVRSRPGIDEVFSAISQEVLCKRVSLYLMRRLVNQQFRADAVEQLPEKWRLEARECETLFVYSISKSGFQMLDELIEKGFDPKYVTRKLAMEELEYYIGAHDGANDSIFRTWTRTTVKNLAARGFPVDCDCVPVIDDKYSFHPLGLSH